VTHLHRSPRFPKKRRQRAEILGQCQILLTNWKKYTQPVGICPVKWNTVAFMLYTRAIW